MLYEHPTRTQDHNHKIRFGQLSQHGETGALAFECAQAQPSKKPPLQSNEDDQNRQD